MAEHHDQDEGYQGPATLAIGETEVDVEVTLRGQFQPIDGRYRWYGRLAVSDELHAIAGGTKVSAVLRTPQGEAAGEVYDPDTWGRYRILGAGAPPFATP